MRLARLSPKAWLACLLALALWAGGAAAHKVNVFAYAEGDKVYTQAYFNDGRPAVGSTIEVYDSSGKLLLKGTTNDEGDFAFPVPTGKGDLRIVLVASMGHKNEYLLPASELPQAPGRAEPTPPRPEAQRVGGRQATPAAEAVPGPAGTAVPVGEERLRAVVGEELDARLVPLARMVARQSEKSVGVSEIAAGIGYIFGLAGVAAYFASRRKLR